MTGKKGEEVVNNDKEENEEDHDDDDKEEGEEEEGVCGVLRTRVMKGRKRDNKKDVDDAGGRGQPQ